MSRVSSLLAVLSLATAPACERVIDVGGAGDLGIDAGADASTDASVDAFMPDPIFGPGATPEQVEAFARALSGRWYGIVTRQNEQQAISVELDFAPDEELIQGGFYFVCTDSEPCNPFGEWASAEGSYYLKHLLAAEGGGVGAATGLLVWREHHDEEQVSFREMLLQRGGEVLSFRFTALVYDEIRGPRAEERTAVVVRTKPSDAGVNDGGPL